MSVTQKIIEETRPRFVLTGTYCSANKGDAAMQTVMARQLAMAVPDADIVISSPFPDRDAPFYAPMRVIKSGRRNLPMAMAHLVLLAIRNVLGRGSRRYPLDEEIDHISRADVVVDLSGDMLTEDYGPLVGWSHFLPLLYAIATGREIAVCAQSIGPFNHLAPIARFALSRSNVTVRERLSMRVFEDIGLSMDSAQVTADLAFLLETATPSRVDEILAAEGIVLTTRCLGVSVSALLTNRRNRHLKNVDGELLAIFANAIDAAARRHGLEVLIISHVFGPREAADDRKVAEQLAKILSVRSHVLRNEYRPEELKGVIGRCAAFVGCRMHANIAALDSEVPVLAVGYSHKTAGIMDAAGQGHHVVSVEALNSERLTERIGQLVLNEEQIRLSLRRALPNLRSLAKTNITRVLELADGRNSP